MGKTQRRISGLTWRVNGTLSQAKRLLIRAWNWPKQMEEKALRRRRGIPERYRYNLDGAQVIDTENGNRFAAFKIQDTDVKDPFHKLQRLISSKRIDRIFPAGSPEVIRWVDWAIDRARQNDLSSVAFENDLNLVKLAIASGRIEMDSIGVYSVKDLPQKGDAFDFVSQRALNPSELQALIHHLQRGNHNRGEWAEVTNDMLQGKPVMAALSPQTLSRNYRQAEIVVNEGEAATMFLEIESLGIRANPLVKGRTVLNTGTWLRSILPLAIRHRDDCIWVVVSLGKTEGKVSRIAASDHRRTMVMDFMERGGLKHFYKARKLDDTENSLKQAIEGALKILDSRRDERHVRMSCLVCVQQSSRERATELLDRVKRELDLRNVSYHKSPDELQSKLSFFPLIKTRDVTDSLDPRDDNITVPFPLGEAVGELVYPRDLKPGVLDEHAILIGRDHPWGNFVAIPKGTFSAGLAGVRAGKTFWLRTSWDRDARVNPDHIYFIMDNKEAVARAKQADFGWISMFPELGGEKRCKAFFSEQYQGPQELREDVMKYYKLGVRHFVYYSSNTLFYTNQTDMGWFWAMEDNINQTEDVGEILIDETLHWFIDVPPTGEVDATKIIHGGDKRANYFWMVLAKNLAEAKRGAKWTTQSASAMRLANATIHAVAKSLTDVWFVGATLDTETLATDVGVNTKVFPGAEDKLVELVLSLLSPDIGPQRQSGRFVAVGKGGSLVKLIDVLVLDPKMVLRYSRREADSGFGA